MKERVIDATFAQIREGPPLKRDLYKKNLFQRAFQNLVSWKPLTGVSSSLVFRSHTVLKINALSSIGACLRIKTTIHRIFVAC